MVRQQTIMKLKLFVFIAAHMLALLCAQAQTAQTLDAKITAIMNRPEFRHALFGIEIYSLSDNKVLYSLNADKLFVPGSVTKVVTEGVTMQLLGADYRFRTPIYRTGPVSSDGVLSGDLVLVASGDPNLSGRVRSADTLAFENEDHAYGQILEAKLVPADPLQVIRDLARQVAAKGVRRIEGRVLVDVTLFREGTKEGGSGVVISPVSVNDNVIDVILTPGKSPSGPTSLLSSPLTKYATFKNQVKTGSAESAAEIDFVPTRDPDGTFSVIVRGTVPAGKAARPFPFVVPQPSRFAEVVLIESLHMVGIEIADNSSSDKPDWKTLAASYNAENQLAQHISPPLREDVKVTLKVSQNLHAAMKPYLLGALLAKEHDAALQAGFKQERSFLERMKLDVSAAAQSDGAGGSSYFTPDFMVKFLAFMTTQKDFRYFHDALPIMGKDGTLWDTQRDSPAAGSLHAKTGTHVTGDLLNEQYVVNGKGLAGYLETKNGKQLIVAIFANHVPAGGDIKTVLKIGDALAEIAAAAYDSQ
jgi:D-alanyl-D-alanine carboxypeptidase/D-alanyl-D-alanine-endopeptidase (penicillin-binding protein 4)